MMGTPTSEPGRYDDEVPHQVKLTRAFLVGATPVTQRLWREVVGRNPSHFEGMDRPVERVSWFDGVEFCNKLSDREGLRPAYQRTGDVVRWEPSADGYRLPTEAEWEYASRAGRRSRYAGGDDVNDVAWHSLNSGHETHPVGDRRPNPWRFHDMSGNVWEWCW